MIRPRSRPAPVVVTGVQKRYGPVPAVAGVSFHVDAGEIVGLLGPNGAGKTTIVEIVEGLRTPDAGEVRLFGDPRGARDKATRARIGVQLQASAMFPGLTVEEQLRCRAALYPDPLPIDEVLGEVDLVDQRRRISTTMSGGQQQRLGLAIALIGRPDLLLLDEPSTGLDPAARRALWTILERFRAAGGSVLLTTHSMEEAEALSDRVAILDHGRFQAVGTVPELAARLGGDRVVFATDPALDSPALTRIPGVTDVVVRGRQTYLLSRDIGATLAGLVDHGRDRGRLPDGIAVRRPSLEEIYLELTGAPLDPALAA